MAALRRDGACAYVWVLERAWRRCLARQGWTCVCHVRAPTQEMGPWAIRREPFERAAAVGMSGSGALVQGLSRVGRLRSPRGR